MQTETGDLWEYHTRGHWVCIPTNGVVNVNGHLVMGRGLALDAEDRYPDLPLLLGQQVSKHGNIVVLCPAARIISFPTKNDWRKPSTLSLIRTSAEQLKKCWPVVEEISRITGVPSLPICLPMVGCGLGGLNWHTQVYPLIRNILDDNYIAVL